MWWLVNGASALEPPCPGGVTYRLGTEEEGDKGRGRFMSGQTETRVTREEPCLFHKEQKRRRDPGQGRRTSFSGDTGTDEDRRSCLPDPVCHVGPYQPHRC